VAVDKYAMRDCCSAYHDVSPSQSKLSYMGVKDWNVCSVVVVDLVFVTEHPLVVVHSPWSTSSVISQRMIEDTYSYGGTGYCCGALR
jgi:hypothetical protein